MADGNITVTVISRPPTPPGWSDTDWLRHLESCLPIGYAVRDTLYGTSKAGVLRLCSSTEAGAFAIYAAPPQRELASEPQAEPVRECADNDSPWLICKPCAAVGRCAKLPVAWRSKERINGEFDSGWKLTSNEPPQTPRTIAIEPLYAHPPQQRKPLDATAVQDLKLAVAGKPYLTVEQLVRQVERLHGITGEQE